MGVSSSVAYSDSAAKRAHCWFDVDRVPRDPATTAWKRYARFHQAQWREARGYPIGAEPYRGGPTSTPIGSRLELAFAQRTGSNFLGPDVLATVRERLANPEKQQTLKPERLWADLLSSMPLCFNLFGALAREGQAARQAVKQWWPDAPSGDVRVRFEHSPGRTDPAFLGNKSAFDAAFEIGVGHGRAVIGVETKYHEHARAEPAPKAAALAHYVEVTERSGVFAEGWPTKLIGTELQQIWLDHLLVLAMLQHTSRQWAWGRFVLVFPSGNPSFSRAAQRYGETLRDPSTFEVRRLEQLATAAALGEPSARMLSDRYI